MCPTILSLDVKVPGERAIGREVVEVQETLEVCADQLFEHRPRTTAGNVKQSEQRGRDTPNPMLFAVVLETCFVAVRVWSCAGIASLSSS